MAATLLVMGALLGLGTTGCSERGAGLGFEHLLGPSWRPPTPGPSPDSPTAALRLLEWSYNNQGILECRGLFAADYHFYFSPLDSVGVAYRDTPWSREDELISTTHLFVGGSTTQPPASSIRLALDKAFLVSPDPRALAWDPDGRWRKNIITQVVLSIQTEDGSLLEISGAASFYLVRGDSAMIPADLMARGFQPDSNRWWIARWDDETAQPGPTPHRARGEGDIGVAGWPRILATLPVRNATWGRVKVLYR